MAKTPTRERHKDEFLEHIRMAFRNDPEIDRAAVDPDNPRDAQARKRCPMTDPFQFGDDLGRAKVVHLHAPRVPLRAVLVIDNVAAGPSIGGVRMAPDVSVAECFRLARAMTLKNAAAGLPHGGGKAAIFADPRQPAADKSTSCGRSPARSRRSTTTSGPGHGHR